MDAQVSDKLTARFWSKVRKGDGPSACWEWTDHGTTKGYGMFTHERRSYYAHRYSYALHYGPIPAALFVCHHCDNPRCVRPSHLFVGTALDNTADAVNKGRMRGRTPKLSRNDIRQICELAIAGVPSRQIASRFGVVPDTIRMVVRGGGAYGRLVLALGYSLPLSRKRFGRKLDSERVAEIRRLASEGVKTRDIAQRYELNFSMVWRIINGRCWQDAG